VRCLELLDQPDIPEPSQVIIDEIRVAGGVANCFLPKLRGWILTEYIGHTHSDGGIVQDSLPARHTVSNRGRRFLLFAHHFLAALRVPGYRRRFHRRGEDQTVGELRVCEPGRMHIVLLKKPIRNLTIERFPESIEQMHGCVQIPVVPRPVKLRISLPFIPGIAASRLADFTDFGPNLF